MGDTQQHRPGAIRDTCQRVQSCAGVAFPMRVDARTDSAHQRINHHQRTVMLGDGLLQQRVVMRQRQHGLIIGDGGDTELADLAQIGVRGHQPRHQGVFPRILHGHIQNGARRALPAARQGAARDLCGQPNPETGLTRALTSCRHRQRSSRDTARPVLAPRPHHRFRGDRVRPDHRCPPIPNNPHANAPSRTYLLNLINLL
ncbi:Uncharacterised protein [Mycobacteroides abscessus subsp. massiliense]|nr:Uncharacterised protein [Mycobacteroides abscessus subsp. massiliense]